MNNAFRANVDQADGKAVIRLGGNINRDADEAMNAAYNQADGLGLANIELDFSDVEYINSTGIALIVGLLAKARVNSRSLSAVGLSEHYREIFKITRLSDFIAIK